MKENIRLRLALPGSMSKGHSVKRFFLLVFLTALAVLIPDKIAWAAGPQGTNFGYDKCTGYIYAEYYCSNDYDEAPDDYAQWGNLFYKNTDGTWVQLLTGDFMGRYGSDKFFMVTSVPGTVRGYASDRYPVYGSDGDDDAEYRARIVLFNMPTDAKYPYELKVQLNWREDHTFSSDDIYDVFHESGAIETQNITAHSVFSVSNDQCGKVVLTWDNPQQTWEMGSGCSVGSAKYFNPDLNGTGYFGAGLTQPNSGNKLSSNAEYYTDVYRDDVLIATVSGASTTYTDATVVDYKQYTYRLRRRIQYKSTTWNTAVYYTIDCNNGCNTNAIALSSGAEYKVNSLSSSFSASATGRTLVEPGIPSNFAGSKDECASAIELTWDWNSNNNPKDFLVYRSNSTSGTYTQVATVDGNQRSYLDESSIVRGTRYYYQIKTRNTCNILSLTYAGTSGVSPTDPAIATNVAAMLNSNNDAVQVTWSDNADNETKYQIIRRDDLGSQMTFDVNPNVTSYLDEGVTACRNYTYSVKVFNNCVASGLISASVSTGTVPPPNLNTSFTASKKLTVSKGYFSNRVELSWQNNNGQNIDLFRIYRKINGTVFDSTLIGTANSGSGFYVDNTADARVYYKYTIIGVKYCNGVDMFTNASEDIGFRNPTGNVSGHIEYNGGIALKGAKVIIQQAGTIRGTSLNFSPGGTLTSVSTSTLGLINQLRLEFWLKPTSSANQTYVEKSGVFSFKRSGSNYVALVNVAGTNYTASVAESNFPQNQWRHVSIQYAGDAGKLKLFSNGVLLQTTIVPNGTVSNINNNVVMGDASASFLMDEFRLLTLAADSATTAIDHARYIEPSTPGSVISLRFDENYGNYAYDGSSQNSVYNANHFIKNSGVTWSVDKPSSGQLGYYGITDELGNYSVSGIVFSGTGENFTIIPSYLTHSFTPNSRSVYMGDASTVFGNQDFVDNSSFTVTGSLFYTNTTCPVPDALLKIDGQVVVSNAEQVKTDANGNFIIEVPIGQHYISVDLYGHTMEVGRFPATGTFDFQDDLAGINFKDSTRRSIVGRVVGGLVEADKVPGLGRSKNNIGKVKVRIVSPIAGVPCFTAEVVTDASSGEYRFEVPPLQYRIDSVYIMNAAQKPVLNSWGSPSAFTNTRQVLDLRNLVDQIKVVDTLFDEHGGIVSIDSTEYHKRHDMIYRIAPMMYVTDTLGGMFIGEKSVPFGNTNITIAPAAGNTWGAFGFPVFLQDKKYAAKIHALEIYTNFDNNQKDSVKLSGKVIVTNELVDGTDPNRNLTLEDGEVTYRFQCGSPNTNEHGLDHDLDYTKTLQINVVPTGAATIEWKPNEGTILPFNKSFSPPVYRAFVLGQRVAGTGIATQGPEKVEFILRDPPGSESFATWSSGTTITETSEYSNILGEDINSSTKLQLGQKTLIGLGALAETEVENNIGLGLTEQYLDASSGATTTVTTTTQSVSTRSDPDNVGSAADIFVGFSRNWLVGPTLNIELVNASQCDSLVGCFGRTVDGKRMVLKKGYAIGPGSIKTRFSYTQKEIETLVIPNLESIRNTQLTTANYTVNVPASDPLFGSNNDDPLWGTRVSTETPEVYEADDADGPSYRFHGTSIDKDTVRILNNQIALWKRALAKNEKEKYECLSNIGVVRSDNFSLGSAVVTKSYATDISTSTTESWELHFSEAIQTEFGFTFMGKGFTQDLSITASQSKTKATTNSTDNTTTFEYTLTDGNDGDLIGVSVYQVEMGNVFIVDGGYTMCPYEDQVVARYYNPATPNAYIGSHTQNTSVNGNAIIQRATVQREVPHFSITPANQYGIPSTQAAVYQLQLSNQSVMTTNNDIEFSMRVDAQSNPYGAVLKIDGQPANTTLTIPAGSSVIKTLTIERGPVEINYDSLMLIFSSACNADIADTAYVSVRFIPTCTDLKMTSPTDNWVFNNSVNNNPSIVVSNYNYNYGAAVDNSTSPATQLGFTKIGLEVRPSSSNAWTEYSAFYKYPATGQLTIPSSQIYSQYQWDISTIPDGTYELKAVSYCLNKDGSYSTVESPVHKGVMDRINPTVFGTPSPADGILDPNDDISIKFNEPIDIGSLTSRNFDVRGVLNGGNSRQSESLSFDGIDDYAEIASGVGLQKRSFTIEFWAMLNGTGVNQTVLSQGTDATQSLVLGFDASNRFTFSMGGQSVISISAVPSPSQWHHYAAVYDYSLQTVNLYADGILVNSGNTSLLYDYNGQGKLVFGKQLPSNTNYFNGNLSDLRLWGKTRTIGEIVLDFNKDLSNTSAGLLYNWKMNEAEGSLTHDVIRSRDAQIYGATWRVTPNGYAAQFDGIDDRIDIGSSTIPVTSEMDFTLEFWFKSGQAAVATLFSNGKGDGTTAEADFAWSIQKDAAGIIHVFHNGYDFVATDKNYFDNTWHHFALVMQRTANLSCYIDGNLQKSVQANSFKQVGGPYMYLGARGYLTGTVPSYDNHFNGAIDEFRFWNTSRKAEQIRRDKQNRMKGDEFGLMAFVPFESYILDPTGIAILSPSFKDYSSEITSVHTDSVFVRNGVVSTSQTPAVKLPRSVQSINFSTTVNNDQIIITPLTSSELIENVTLDVTVKDVYDLHGNKMTSPKTWIAYINKNQVLWQDVELAFTKKQEEVITFSANVVNKGGALKEYTIGGLPSWLVASTTSGSLSPNSTQAITFTIPAGTPVGDYDADLTLTTDFGYAEVLRITLKVTGDEPQWVVNPADFKYSMSVVGEIKIDGVLATSTATKIAAFINNTVCGTAYLTYMKPYDRYEVFLNIYSNNITGDSVSFRVYDATTGITFVNVKPRLMFAENEITGTVNNPVTFIANSEVGLNIPLKSGWTWISLPLSSTQLQHSNLLMDNVVNAENDIVRTIDAYDQYASGLGWIGTISSSPDRFDNNKMYQVKRSAADTLVLTGVRINPADAAATINVVPGWNWIGYVATKNADINTAMSGYTALTGDILKSQYEFSVYDNNTGWIGSLTTLRPGLGYMLKSTASSTFQYPLSVFYGSAMRIASESASDEAITLDYAFSAWSYEKTMSVIAQSNLCEDLKARHTVLAAFDSQNTLRGYAHPSYNAKTKNEVYYLTVYGNDSGETLQLKYINPANGIGIPAETAIIFSADALLGMPDSPVQATVASEFSCLTGEVIEEQAVQVYPNPFSNKLNITFNHEVDVALTFTDLLGKVYTTLNPGNKSSIELDLVTLNLTEGVYLLHISGEVNITTKVIKTN